MRKISWIVTLCLLSLMTVLLVYAVQVDGQVVDGDGVPQAEVKVEFFGDNLHSAWTDDNGEFSIADVAEGEYQVKVTGPGEQTFKVDVDGEGMHPNPLIVDW